LGDRRQWYAVTCLPTPAIKEDMAGAAVLVAMRLAQEYVVRTAGALLTLKVIVSPVLKIGPPTISMVGPVAATDHTLMACDHGDITAPAWVHTPFQL